MSNSRHCLISLYKTILCCGFCILMCALSYTRAYYNKKKVTLIWGLQIVYQLHLTIYSFRARALKKEENDRYLSSILAMQVVFFFKMSMFFEFHKYRLQSND